MNDFNLDTNGIKVSRRGIQRTSSISTWLIRHKVVKTESQASLLLSGVILLCILIIIFLNWPGQATEPIDEKYYQDVILDE